MGLRYGRPRAHDPSRAPCPLHGAAHGHNPLISFPVPLCSSKAPSFPLPATPLQLVLASVFDLLTGQCDRHSENVFVTAEGRLTLIDNDRALGVVERCRSNSMLLPTNA